MAVSGGSRTMCHLCAAHAICQRWQLDPAIFHARRPFEHAVENLGAIVAMVPVLHDARVDVSASVLLDTDF